MEERPYGGTSRHGGCGRKGMSMAPLHQERLMSLDVLRGITIAGMILVNNPGDWSVAFAPLQHALWHGWTPTDWIFPGFLFIVGVSTALSLSRHLGAECRQP